jgi:hypothetical protein
MVPRHVERARRQLFDRRLQPDPIMDLGEYVLQHDASSRADVERAGNGIDGRQLDRAGDVGDLDKIAGHGPVAHALDLLRLRASMQEDRKRSQCAQRALPLAIRVRQA